LSNYYISKVYPKDKQGNQSVDNLLKEEGISRDKNLDYTCAMYDDDMNVVATGSCFGNTLRCLAVSSKHQGEGLLNQVITHLMEVQCARGNTHLFIYTKSNTSRFFGDLGFYEIASVNEQVVFMENRRTGFSDYLKNLAVDKIEAPKAAALVVNCNPFTLGHLYLIEKAAAENDILHLFIVSEDASLVPFNIRKRLVKEGTAHLNNIRYHDSGPYIISSATFPSYFQKDEVSVIKGHALLDLTIFKKIGETLGVNRRYVGEEPTSQVTNIYNQIMQEELPKANIECIVVPRKESGGRAISASTVRKAIHDGDIEHLKELVPQTTLDYFLSEEAKPVIEHIKNSENVIHY
jgi:[citrate (pro-3S)-lyase] ligase